MSTIIIGDVAEGVKYWSVANQLKTQLKAVHGKTNPFMNTWKQVDASTRIFVKLVNGEPTAFIYVSGAVPYEFSVYIDDLVKYFDKKVDTEERALSMANLHLPINIWYGKAVLKEGAEATDVWVTAGAARRYSSPRTTYKTPEANTPMPVDLPAVVYDATGAVVFTSPSEVMGAAIVGSELYGVSSSGMAYAWSILDSSEIYSEQITGAWDVDDAAYSDAWGYWTFNRAGNKAVATCYASQFKRFNPSDTRTLIPGGWLRSFIQEVEFGGTLILSDPIETEGLCIAADYDWSVPENPIIYAQYRLVSYAKKAAKKWEALTEYAIGDHIVVIDPPVEGITEINSRVYTVESFEYDVPTFIPGTYQTTWSSSKKSGSTPPKWRAESRPQWITPDIFTPISSFTPEYYAGIDPNAVLFPRRRNGGLWLVETTPIDSRDLRIGIRHADDTPVIEFSVEQNSVNAYSTGVGTDKDWWFSLRDGNGGLHNVAGALDLRVRGYAVADIYGDSAKIGAYGQEYSVNENEILDGDGGFVPNSYEVIAYPIEDDTVIAALQTLGELSTVIAAYNYHSWFLESSFKPSPNGNATVGVGLQSPAFPHTLAEEFVNSPLTAIGWATITGNIAYFITRVTESVNRVLPEALLAPFDTDKINTALQQINTLANTLPAFRIDAHDLLMTYPSGDTGDPVTEEQIIEVTNIVADAFFAETEVYDKMQDIITSVREMLSDKGTSWRGQHSVGGYPAVVAMPYLFVDEAHLKNIAIYLNSGVLGAYETLQVDLLIDDKGQTHHGYHQNIASGAVYDIFRLAGAWVGPLIEK